jgi:hypothetical protein
MQWSVNYTNMQSFKKYENPFYIAMPVHSRLQNHNKKVTYCKEYIIQVIASTRLKLGIFYSFILFHYIQACKYIKLSQSISTLKVI